MEVSQCDEHELCVPLWFLLMERALLREVARARNAARALGMQDTHGILAPGYAADFAVWNFDSLDELGYWSGFNRCRAVIREGRRVRGG